jgi:hypothetical protein
MAREIGDGGGGGNRTRNFNCARHGQRPSKFL